ncbi:LuxR C-terminal-related transcriptional regulator [Pseudonocardia xishanensis]|uniref:LuxR C-terminal-related transcriptional regulator n=1 Tax=Pseudonocardia xishanensis TaxID=630995 RepID=UPI0031EE6238
MPDASVRIPRPAHPVVARTAVRSALDRGRDTVLVRGAAGFGKTTAVADWARSTGDTAWVTLEAADADPRRLWTAVLTALVRTPGGADLEAELDPDRAGDPRFPSDLAAALDHLARPPTLVLDALDALEEADPHEDAPWSTGLRDLLHHRRPDARVVLCSRGDPRLRLARLRVAGRLTEIGPEVLRCDGAEAAALLAATAPGLPVLAAARLARLTAGWPVGLRLAGLAVAEAASEGEPSPAFDGAHRLLAGYLTDEVLPHLTEAETPLLRATSVADPVPPDLAVELTGDADAGRTLDELGRRTSLAHRLDADGADGPAHRVEPLLRMHLLAELSRNDRCEYHRLEAVAARRLSASAPALAVDHVVRSADADAAAEVLRTTGVPLFVRGRFTLLRRALRVAGAETSRDPWLATLDALAARRPLPQAVPPEWPPDPSAELAVLRAAAEDWGVVPRRPGRHDTVALPTDPAHRALGLVVQAVEALRAGSVPSVETTVEAVRLADEHGFAPLGVQACAIAAVAAMARGDVVVARDTAAQALARADRIALPRSRWSAAAAAVLGLAALVRGRPGEVLDWTGRGAGTPEDPIELSVGTALVEAAARFDLADGAGPRAAALDALCEVRQSVGGRPMDARIAAFAALVEHRAALALGRRTAARGVLGWLRERVGETPETALMRGWTEFAAGRDDGARAAARRTLAGAEGAPILVGLTEVESLLLEANVAAGRAERAAVRGSLDAALAAAEPLRAVRPFTVAGSRLREILTRLYGGRADTGSFAAEVLTAIAHETDGSTRLSDRERDVLELLPSLLSLAEIGEDLSVSLNTVKTHVRSIYTKLGVNTRRTAVLAGYERGLIRPARALTSHA